MRVGQCAFTSHARRVPKSQKKKESERENGEGDAGSSALSDRCTASADLLNLDCCSNLHAV